jgi:hypothetical protein
MLPEPHRRIQDLGNDENSATDAIPLIPLGLPGSSQVNGPAMLVKESIWSRRLYVPPPTTYGDLMIHLGKELARTYHDPTQEALPETWSELLSQLP